MVVGTGGVEEEVGGGREGDGTGEGALMEAVSEAAGVGLTGSVGGGGGKEEVGCEGEDEGGGATAGDVPISGEDEVGADEGGGGAAGAGGGSELVGGEFEGAAAR